MGASSRPFRPERTETDITKSQGQTQSGTENRTAIPRRHPAQQSRADHGQERNAIRQIGRSAHVAGRDRNTDPLPDLRPDPVVDTIGSGAAAEHLRQVLATTPALLVAAAATALLNLDDGLPTLQPPNDGEDSVRFPVRAHQRRSGAMSSRGRSLAATASRARKIRERTVPIGQSMMLAISS